MRLESKFGIIITLVVVAWMMIALAVEEQHDKIEKGFIFAENEPSYNPYLLEPNSKIIPEDELPYYDFLNENMNTDDQSIIAEHDKIREYSECLNIGILNENQKSWYRYYYDTEKFECIVKLTVSTPKGQV